MRQLIITLENIKEVKPSEFVHSFISDIDTARHKMDMSSYDAKYPCLGGVAARNLGLNYDFVDSWNLGTVVARIGNTIRQGSISNFKASLIQLYPNYKSEIIRLDMDGPNTRFYGTVRKKAYPLLKKQVLYYVNILKKAGI